jgi:hypothetical protein
LAFAADALGARDAGDMLSTMIPMKKIIKIKNKDLLFLSWFPNNLATRHLFTLKVYENVTY